jgi:hypothetical protein
MLNNGSPEKPHLIQTAIENFMDDQEEDEQQEVEGGKNIN